MSRLPANPSVRFRYLRWPLLALVACVAVLIANQRTATQAATSEADLALVLAIDCSYSVDDREFRLQMDGIAQAFRSPQVQAAIARGAHGRIAVSAVLWSSVKYQQVVVPWTFIGGPAEAERFAQTIERARRIIPVGGTSISQALLYSAQLLNTVPAKVTRKVIDVSSDGRNNSGRAATLARDQVSALGITINALVVPSPEWTILDKWFERNVIGGPFHFVMVADTYDDYAEAIYRKLLREITGPGIS
jgi:hypothetical protein